MKPPVQRSRRKRIILQYVIWVILPGLILGYMAFRGILNDQALREKESRLRMESVSRLFFSDLDSLVFHVAEPGNEQSGNDGQSDYSSPSVRLSFTGGGPEGSRILTQRLLFLPEGSLQKVAGFPMDLPEELVNARHRESDPDQGAASLQAYQKILDQTPDSVVRCLARMGCARILGRQGKADEALRFYDQTINFFNGYLPGNPFPPALSALLESARLEKANVSQASNLLLVDLYRRLDRSDPPLEAPVFDFFLREAGDLYSGGDPDTDSLIRDIGFRRAETQYLIRFMEDPLLLAQGHGQTERASVGQLTFFPMNINGLIVATDVVESADKSQTFTILDLGILLGEMPSLYRPEDDRGPGYQWSVRDAGGRVIAGLGSESPMTGRFNFPGHYPKWILEMGEVPQGTLKGLFGSGHLLYILVFLFIILMMAFGLVFTLHTLNQEFRLNKLKSEFISNVSHELKSPLTSIRQHAELLDQKRVPDTRRPGYFRLIREQSEHLSHLIDNLLDFSRMEDDRKRYRFEMKDPDELVRRVVDGFNSRQAGQLTSVVYSCESNVVRVSMDTDSMEQVFYNLIDNAIKFSGKSEPVEVRLIVEGDDVVVTVKDSGIGIAEKDLPHIFERFYRGEEGREKGIRGSGIGLTLVKRIVEAHQGRITASSKSGKGSEFRVQLPINQHLT